MIDLGISKLALIGAVALVVNRKGVQEVFETVRSIVMVRHPS